MDARAYWAEVKEERASLSARLANAEGQPNDGTVYIVSRKDRAKGTTAGAVSLATVEIAAQRFVDGTHEIASAEQISKFLDERQAEFTRSTNVEIARKQQFVVHVGAQPEAPRRNK